MRIRSPGYGSAKMNADPQLRRPVWRTWSDTDHFAESAAMELTNKGHGRLTDLAERDELAGCEEPLLVQVAAALRVRQVPDLAQANRCVKGQRDTVKIFTNHFCSKNSLTWTRYKQAIKDTCR